MADEEHEAGGGLAERVVGSRTVYRGHYLELRVDEIERADGSRGTREVVGHPGAVAIVALDDQDRVLLVRQWRVPADRALLEVPAGTLNRDPASDEMEEPGLAAARELEEETGSRAGRWEHLGTFWTAPGFTTERMWLYLATGLHPADGETLAPDADERLQLERVPFLEAVAMAERGDIADAKSIVGLFWLARRRAAADEARPPQSSRLGGRRPSASR